MNSQTITEIEQQDAKTASFFAVTKGHDLTGQAGRLTLAQAACLMDAIGSVRTVCAHVWQLNRKGEEMPAQWTEALAPLDLSLSLARARQILILWHKWAHPLGSRDCPFSSSTALTYVQGFVWALRGK